MHKAVAFFKKTRPFSEYYAEWFDTLKNTLLPLLRHSLSSSPSMTLLSVAVDSLHRHFQSYYSALDLVASDNHLPTLLSPPWRNPLEKPFLFLGDLHPYLFTNLLRSLLDEGEDDDDNGDELQDDQSILAIDESQSWPSDRPWQISTAWKDPSKFLISRIEQIERGLRLMVPALSDRVKAEQAGFAARVAGNWAKCEGNGAAAVREAALEEMEGLVGVFLDCNRLRKSVLADIISATNVYQAGLFLESLAQFLVGLRDSQLVEKFGQCKMKLP